MSFFIGVELGQVSDGTAVAVVESLTLPILRTEQTRRPPSDSLDRSGWPFASSGAGPESPRAPSPRFLEAPARPRQAGPAAKLLATVAARTSGDSFANRVLL